jgi:Domain of unknown function (DUF892)
MIEHSSDQQLKQAFQSHLQETEVHVTRLEELIGEVNEGDVDDKKDAIATALIGSGENIVSESDDGPLRDAGLLATAQKIEHYEIASCSPEAKLFNIEFSDLHVSKEDPVELGCDQLKSQLFETEYFADKDSGFVPADIAAIVHPSEKNTLRVRVLRQLARHSNGAGNVNICRNLVVQTLMRALIIEDVAKLIEAALLRA